LFLTGAETPPDGSPAKPNEAKLDDAKKKDAKQSPRGESAEVQHGKYLVHHVAMCVICHTPKTETGALVENKLLRGARIPVKNLYPGQPWALKAPELAGLPGGWSEKSLAKFLQTGKPSHGHDVRPPMPPFRMNAKDAKAVAAYLKSLDAD
jgi:mono/diheme cytochrome c family protein